MKLVFSIFLLCLSLPAHAIFRVDGGSPRGEPQRTWMIRSVIEAQGYVDLDQSIVEHLYKLERSLGDQFSEQELIDGARKFADVRNLTFKQRPHCFTCRMLVLTPTGYRRIDSLKSGDAVISWDSEQNQILVNWIKQVVSAESVAFGELPSHGTSEEPFEVTADHPFFVPLAQDFQPLASIGTSEKLLHIKASGKTCETNLVSRGEFLPRGTAEVFTLKLEMAPHNFIVNGLVVHNKTRE